MAKLTIKYDDRHFSSDSISHGRLIKAFFKKLTTNVFRQAVTYHENALDISGCSEIPLLYTERNLYSMFAVAIDKITPVHLSEWSLNNIDESAHGLRRVDFWCLHRNGDSGVRLNYFIELKKSHYCVSSGTVAEFANTAIGTINDLHKQVVELKKIKPSFEGDGNVFMGIAVIHGYHSPQRDASFDERDVLGNIQKLLDKRFGQEVIMATWLVPEGMETQWNSSLCKFVAIVGIVITKRK